MEQKHFLPITCLRSEWFSKFDWFVWKDGRWFDPPNSGSTLFEIKGQQGTLFNASRDEW